MPITLTKQETALLLSDGSTADEKFWLSVGHVDEVVNQHADLLNTYNNTDPTQLYVTLPNNSVELIGDRPPRPIKND